MPALVTQSPRTDLSEIGPHAHALRVGAYGKMAPFCGDAADRGGHLALPIALSRRMPPDPPVGILGMTPKHRSQAQWKGA
jgi:hypothetical protein